MAKSKDVATSRASAKAAAKHRCKLAGGAKSKAKPEPKPKAKAKARAKAKGEAAAEVQAKAAVAGSSVDGQLPRVDCRNPELLTVLAPITSGELDSGREASASLLKVATALMNEWDFLIAGQWHRIVELEAYVHGPLHADPYVHGSEDQLFAGSWYFHKQGNTFKAGSFKGLDITAGNGAAKVRAGLLVRAIAWDDPSNGGRTCIVEGPCLVVDHILRLHGVASIAEFLGQRGALGFPPPVDRTPGLQLSAAEPGRRQRVWAAPRVGLVLRRPDAEATHSSGVPERFCTRPYRFSTLPERLTKFRSGFAVQARLDGNEADVGSLGLPRGTLEGYLASLAKGQSHSDPSRLYDTKLANQQVFCELVGACAESVRKTR